MEKQQKFKHWVNSEGHLDVRIATQYINDVGRIEFEELNPSSNKPALTPADTSKMDDWDDRSKDIVFVLADPKVLFGFGMEKIKGITVKGKTYKHPSKITGVGIEETCTYDFEVEETGKIKGRYIFRIFDNGIEKKKSYLRHEINPGISTIYGNVTSRAVAQKLHTPEVIVAHKAKMAEQAKKLY